MDALLIAAALVMLAGLALVCGALLPHVRYWLVFRQTAAGSRLAGQLSAGVFYGCLVALTLLALSACGVSVDSPSSDREYHVDCELSETPAPRMQNSANLQLPDNIS